MNIIPKYFTTLLLVLALVLVSSVLNTSEASEIDQLKAQISDRNNKISEIEAEIAKFEKELAKTSGEAKTLRNAIDTLNVARNKYLRDIQLTEAKIHNTSLEINEIIAEIADKEEKIIMTSKAAAESIRRINEMSSDSLLATVLRHNKLSEYFESVSSLEKVQGSLSSTITSLSELKISLEDARNKAEQGRQSLVVYKEDLSGQKQVIENNKAEQDRLLKITQNKEAEYQRLLNEKIANKKQFESELFQFEAQLKIKIDPGLIPAAGKGVLSWPLDSIHITQRFGRTVDAQTLYVSGSHSGVDFRAAVGTRVKAVLSGVVEGVGNTDLSCPNASYGKWVLIRHANGLSSLYAHLDVISVSKGQVVTTGDRIGFSGNTGYSTGPHLHLTIFASQGVKIGSLPSRACAGAVYTIPLADTKAYLDPLSYLQ
jgi:murein DD-endopeptidase MepM/ murein hydrolase activator NlpD